MALLGNVMRAVFRRGKYVKRQGDHGVISAKRGNKQYYKGNRGHKPGVHTDKGGFVMRPRMMMDIQQPAASDTFKLKAYVSPTARKVTSADVAKAMAAAAQADAAATSL